VHAQAILGKVVFSFSLYSRHGETSVGLRLEQESVRVVNWSGRESDMQRGGVFWPSCSVRSACTSRRQWPAPTGRTPMMSSKSKTGPFFRRTKAKVTRLCESKNGWKSVVLDVVSIWTLVKLHVAEREIIVLLFITEQTKSPNTTQITKQSINWIIPPNADQLISTFSCLFPSLSCDSTPVMPYAVILALIQASELTFGCRV